MFYTLLLVLFFFKKFLNTALFLWSSLAYRWIKKVPDPIMKFFEGNSYEGTFAIRTFVRTFVTLINI